MKKLISICICTLFWGCGQDTSAKKSQPLDPQNHGEGSSQTLEESGTRNLIFSHNFSDNEKCGDGAVEVKIENQSESEKATIIEENICLEDGESKNIAEGQLHLSDGQSFLYRIHTAPLKTCPAGGLTLSLFQDSNKDEKISLERDQLVLTLPSCNGKDGENGVNAAISTLRFESHTDCSDGGMMVETWSDYNNNATFEKDVDQDYQKEIVCDGNGFEEDFSTAYSSKSHSVEFKVNRYGFIAHHSPYRELGTFFKFEAALQNEKYIIMEPLYYQCTENDQVMTFDRKEAISMVMKGTEPTLSTFRRQQKELESERQGLVSKSASQKNDRKIALVNQEKTQKERALFKSQKELSAKRIAAAKELKSRKNDERDVLIKRDSKGKKEVNSLSQALKEKNSLVLKQESMLDDAKKDLGGKQRNLRSAADQLAMMSAHSQELNQKLKNQSQKILVTSRQIEKLNQKIGDEETKYFARKSAKKELVKVQAHLMNLISEQTILRDEHTNAERNLTIQKASKMRSAQQVKKAEELTQSINLALLKSKEIAAELTADLEKEKSSVADIQSSLMENKLVLKNLTDTLVVENREFGKLTKQLDKSRATLATLAKKIAQLDRLIPNTLKNLSKTMLKIKNKKVALGSLVERRNAFASKRKFTYELLDSKLTLHSLERKHQSIQLFSERETQSNQLISCDEFHLPLLNDQ